MRCLKTKESSLKELLTEYNSVVDSYILDIFYNFLLVCLVNYSTLPFDEIHNWEAEKSFFPIN